LSERDAKQRMSLVAHCKVLFSTTIESQDKGSPRDLIYQASQSCFAPLDYIKKQWSDPTAISSFLVNPSLKRSVIPIPPTSSPSTFKTSHLVLALMFIVPGTVIGTALRLVLFVASSYFRSQHQKVVEHLLLQEIKVQKPDTVDVKINLIADIWSIIGKDLSIRDICQVAQVSRQWYNYSDRLFHEKAISAGIDVPPNEARKRIMDTIYLIYNNSCKSVLEPLGVERIFFLPQKDIVSMKVSELLKSKNGPIFRSADGSSIAFCCEESNLPGETGLPDKGGVLVINRSRFANIKVFWRHFVHDDLSAYFPIEPATFTSECVTQLIQGQQIKLNGSNLAPLEVTMHLKLASERMQ
jgi:hypothetical protein